jgi:hypothetical protein
MRKLLFVLAAIAGAAALTWQFAVRPWWRSWGIDPGEVSRTLPGDELIPGATGETRAISIDASPSAVWPWLVQMGYGRGGWYVYEAMDAAWPSADRILPQHQTLAEGDIVGFQPGGGFVVRGIEPERSLVLYLDADLVRQQAVAARDSGLLAEAGIDEEVTEALTTEQEIDFSATWAFVLEPLPSGGTRLIERFRVKFGDTNQPWTRYTLPFMGFGLFVLVRKQLLNIKARAEGTVPVVVTEKESLPA